MSWTIIVASSDSDQLDELLIGAHQIKRQLRPADDVVVVEATSVEEVESERQRSLHAQNQLLIVTASLPNSRSSPDLQGQAGLNLIKSVAREADRNELLDRGLILDHEYHGRHQRDASRSTSARDVWRTSRPFTM